MMNDLETRFRNTSPEIETLPAAQRALAARLADQANAMQSARKQYAQAVQSQDADANDRLKELQAERPRSNLKSPFVVRNSRLSSTKS